MIVLQSGQFLLPACVSGGARTRIERHHLPLVPELFRFHPEQILKLVDGLGAVIPTRKYLGDGVRHLWAYPS